MAKVSYEGKLETVNSGVAGTKTLWIRAKGLFQGYDLINVEVPTADGFRIGSTIKVTVEEVEKQ